MDISEHAVITASSQQVSCDLAGEAAILNLDNGVYYGLDPVGTRIWSLLQTPITLGEIEAVILSEYDVDPDRCRRDILALFDDLLKHGLLEIRDGDGS